MDDEQSRTIRARSRRLTGDLPLPPPRPPSGAVSAGPPGPGAPSGPDLPSTSFVLEPEGEPGLRWGAIAVVALLLVGGVVLVQQVRGGDDDGSQDATVPLDVAGDVTTPADDSPVLGVPDDIDELLGVPDPTTSTTTSTTTTTTTTTTSVPEQDGGWAALFISDPAIGAVRAVQAQLQPRVGQEVLVFESADYASLRPGFWVAGVIGFADAGRALDLCRQLGRGDSSQCAARRLLNGPGVTWDAPPGSGTTNPAYLALP
jgi:hypothetical protein